MKTIQTRAVVDENGRITLAAVAPADVQPGEHDALVILDEKPLARSAAREFEFPVDSYGSWPADLSLRRVDLCGDRGR